jgi:hypothetical protein
VPSPTQNRAKLIEAAQDVAQIVAAQHGVATTARLVYGTPEFFKCGL